MLDVFFIYNNYNYFFFFDFDFNFFLSYFYFKQYFEEYDSNKNSLEKEQNCIELEIDSFEIFWSIICKKIYIKTAFY